MCEVNIQHLKSSVRWPGELTAPQLQKTHAKRQNTSKLRNIFISLTTRVQHLENMLQRPQRNTLEKGDANRPQHNQWCWKMRRVHHVSVLWKHCFCCVAVCLHRFFLMCCIVVFAAHFLNTSCVFSNWWRCFLKLLFLCFCMCCELSGPPYWRVFILFQCVVHVRVMSSHMAPEERKKTVGATRGSETMRTQKRATRLCNLKLFPQSCPVVSSGCGLRFIFCAACLL